MERGRGMMRMKRRMRRWVLSKAALVCVTIVMGSCTKLCGLGPVSNGWDRK